MSKSLKKLIDINRLREFKNKLVGTDSAYVQTGAVDQTVAGTKTFSKPIAGSVTGSSGSCTGNAATATTATTAKACTGNAATATTATTAKACTGNAATATKLATARSLWGNNFDGSAAISGTITGTPSIEFKPTATTSNNGGFLDFHYNQSTADYTSRIIESASGTLSINNVTITTGKVVTATTFNGALKGNVTGNCSGSSGSCTGNAATATKATQDSDGNKIATTYSKNGHTHDDRYYTEAEVNNLLAGKANSSHTHPYIPTSASCNKNWHWQGQGGQPSWLWGGEDGTNMYVYNPSDFRVNYANSANSAVTANYAKFVRTPDNSHTITFDWSSQVPNHVGLRVDATNMGGIVTTANATRSLASLRRPAAYDIGSTIYARTDSQAEYGATVAGSQLKYAAMDSGDDIYDPNRQLTTAGTWLKVSGNSGNTGGSGLYRRIA